MNRLKEEDSAGEGKERQREAVKASRGVTRRVGRGQGASGKVGRRGGAVIGSKGPLWRYVNKPIHHEISLA